MECYKCKKEINDKASFCPNCGADLSKKDDSVVCSKCKAKNNIGASFCENCGAKLKEETDKWNFDSKIITITFWICAILTTYLISCPGFLRYLEIEASGLGWVLIGFGIFLILFKNKEKIDIHKEVDNIKKIKLSKVQIGFLFVISGIFCLLGLGSQIRSLSFYLEEGFILFVSFIIMLDVIAYKNFNKLATVGQIACLLISLVCFGFSIQQYGYGNELNSSYEHQFESFWYNGTANPGNDNLEISKYLMIAGIVFLVLFVVITFYKKKKQN